MEPNESTFKDLIKRHKDLIWRICSSYRLSAAWTTEDAFHEVLCNLWNGMDTFDKRSTERTWVFRVATNTMISITRKMGNQPMPLADEQPAAAYKEEPYSDLIDLIETIKEPDRTIIKAHLQGFSYAEIAKMTGLSIAAAGMRLSRTLRLLRKQYNR